MLLRGTIEIAGMVLPAVVEVTEPKERRKYVSLCPNGKWRAYKIVEGRNQHLGYYDTEAAALKAARQGVNLAAARKGSARSRGIHKVTRSKGVMWRSTYVPAAGPALRLGDYLTEGAAVLVRDVVARRCGGVPIVPDYEMPLALVSNAVARSFIRDVVAAPSPAEIEEYHRRINLVT